MERGVSRPALPLTAILFVACASGGGSVDGTLLPRNQGYAGGTQAFGGFAGAPSSIQDSVIPQSRSQVWNVLPSVFAELEIETPTVNRVAYQMGNPGSRISRIAGSSRLSQYLDCGMGILGPNADTYEVNLQLLVQLASHASGGTLVRTTVDAYARPRTSSGDPIHCASQRTLEGRVLGLIHERLRPTAPADESVTGLSPAGAAPLPAGRAAALPPMSPGRLPVPGDVLRVECQTLDGPDPIVGQGTFLASQGGIVQILLDSRGSTAGVPAARVVNVEIRERRSAARIGGFIGLALGATAGALYGSSYEEENPRYPKFHYPKEVFIAVGGVVGGLGGLLLGRVTGSFFVSDTWHQAPPEWAIRSSGASPVPLVDVSPCPTF